MQKVIFSFLLVLALTASSSVLAAEETTAVERKENLRLACLNEAEWSTDQKKKKYLSHRAQMRVNSTEETSKLKALCREMTDTYSTKEEE